jgi:hypothetical protein
VVCPAAPETRPADTAIRNSGARIESGESLLVRSMIFSSREDAVPESTSALSIKTRKEEA